MPSKNKIVETARYLTKSIKGDNFVNRCCIYANTGCALVFYTTLLYVVKLRLRREKRSMQTFYPKFEYVKQRRDTCKNQSTTLLRIEGTQKGSHTSLFYALVLARLVSFRWFSTNEKIPTFFVSL